MFSMFNKVRYLFVKELIQTLRDKRMRITLIVPPILQLIIFGYAANLDVKHIRTAVRDLEDLGVQNILMLFPSLIPRKKSETLSIRGWLRLASRSRPIFRES